ncbi:MAG: outer membrane beta-barrel domain-containing protein [Myxococcota bacterium]
MKRLWPLLCLPFTLYSVASPAQEVATDSDLAAEESEDTNNAESSSTGLTLAERIRAVSRPVFRKEGRFELAPVTGVSVSDSFFRRWTVGARGSYHLVDSFAVDFGGALNAWSEPLEAAVFLGVDEQPALDDPAPLVGYADVGVTFEPFYGKVALMSEWILHFDSYLGGGAGVVVSSGATPIAPALEVGGGARLFLNRWLALRADLRDYVYVSDFGDGNRLQQLFMVNLGVGIFFPFSFEDDRDVVKQRGG